MREYNIVLTGEEVPDERGTYYICLSDNATIISGSPTTAKDLLTAKGEKVQWRIKVAAGDSKSTANCQYINGSPQKESDRHKNLIVLKIKGKGDHFFLF